jgi:hypothetical protein
LTGDQNDVKRVCKQVMNKSAGKRIISKQEASVILGDLDMFTCSETIESVSISNSKLLRLNEQKSSSNNTILKKYINRPKQYDNISLYEYFHLTKKPTKSKKDIVPHFVGISGTPKYPPTETYARHVLTVYKPWRKYPKKCDWIPDFETFINSAQCPASARMHYERAMCRYYDHMTHYDPKSSDVDHTGNPISDDDAELIQLLGLKGTVHEDEDALLIKQMDRGLEFDWGKPAKVSYEMLVFQFIT